MMLYNLEMLVLCENFRVSFLTFFRIKIEILEMSFATVAGLAVMKPSNAPVLRKGKWGVTREEYNAETYPAYC